MPQLLPPVQLDPLETELVWNLVHGLSVKEAAKSLEITPDRADYILLKLRRKFVARTNVQLAFLFAVLLGAQLRQSGNDTAQPAGDNGADSQQPNDNTIIKLCSK